ncbi:hypothetical protein EDB89DRAFT_321168 [Lactarius sanguifluus]|nr:hypothetical protein EDB89DRAFT_321168 [Lactarius sanguifluus]
MGLMKGGRSSQRIRITYGMKTRPVAPFALNARQNPSIPMVREVIFDIAFVIALFFACLGSFAWLTSGGTAELFNRKFFAVPVAFFRQLAVFCRPASILDANNVNVTFIPRRGGASYPIATVPWGLQGGGPRRVEVVRGGGDDPDGVGPVHTVL